MRGDNDDNVIVKKDWLEIIENKTSVAGKLLNKMRMNVDFADYRKLRKRFDFMYKNKNLSDVKFEEIYFENARCEWIFPNDSNEDKVILAFHGGGFIVGSGAYCRREGVQIAKATGYKTLSVDYRLAPEHPFPAALEDAVSAYQGLLYNGITPSNIVLYGVSAGANLCLALCLKLQDNDIPLPRATVVLSPLTDLTDLCYSRDTKANVDPILSIKCISSIKNYYVKNQDLKNKYISILYGNYFKFPSTLVVVGENEILLSDSLLFGEKAYKEGVDVKVKLWRGMMHAFPTFGMLPESRQAMQEISEFIKNKLK